MLDTLLNFLRPMGLSQDIMMGLAIILASCAILFLALLAYLFTRFVIVKGLAKAIKRTNTKRDDTLKKMNVFSRLSHAAPAIVIYALGPTVFEQFPAYAQAIEVLSLLYLIVMMVLFVDALLSAALVIYQTFEISRTFPITSFVQVAKLVLYFIGAIAVLSLVLGESPVALFAGLGAATAVLMLVFKDPILGFVAGIQLTANQMVAVGDWIEMPRYAVDGDVIEIGLTTVKIRNFDRTITSIPTQSLINDSFKNWRGMKETGGRRIKRALHIDVSSIKFCDHDMLMRYSRIQFISDYIAKKRADVAEHNSSIGVDTSTLVNGRHLTNIGTFRAYIEAYLRAHPDISDQLTFLVRQLKPTEHGLPIEVYVFTTTTNWVEYERIQSDIFDHLLAAATEFDLRLFQNPTGADFSQWSADIGAEQDVGHVR
ncbi:MAG: mechanosensitive ion channel domain-containing protein [Pseudomonadota bacterium]